MSSVVHIAPRFLTLHWAIVVRYTVWFLVAAYFTHVLVGKFLTPNHVMYKNLIHGLRVELNIPAVMVIRMDYVEFKAVTPSTIRQ